MTEERWTYTVLTRRQRFGFMLAMIAMAITFAFALTCSINLWMLTGPVEESKAELNAWTYVLDERGLLASVAYPPILLGIGLALAISALGRVIRFSKAAPRGPFQEDERRRGKVGRAGRKERWRAARHNYRSQIRELGGVFPVQGRVSRRLGVALGGSALVVGVSLSATTKPFDPNSTAIGEHAGFLPWVCLVCGGIAVVGVLLTFPYGPRQNVTVDASGNVRKVTDATQPTPRSRAKSLVEGHL